MLVEKVKEEYNVDIAIGYLVYSFPSSIYAINIEVEDIAEVRDLRVKLDTMQMFKGSFYLKSFVLHNLKVFVNKSDTSFVVNKVVGKGRVDVKSQDMDINLRAYDILNRMFLSLFIVSDNDIVKTRGSLDLDSFSGYVGIKKFLGVKMNDFLSNVVKSSNLDVKIEFSFETTMSNPIEDLGKVVFSGDVIAP